MIIDSASFLLQHCVLHSLYVGHLSFCGCAFLLSCLYVVTQVVMNSSIVGSRIVCKILPELCVVNGDKNEVVSH
jgi:hypothetical protein